VIVLSLNLPFLVHPLNISHSLRLDILQLVTPMTPPVSPPSFCFYNHTPLKRNKTSPSSLFPPVRPLISPTLLFYFRQAIRLPFPILPVLLRPLFPVPLSPPPPESKSCRFMDLPLSTPPPTHGSSSLSRAAPFRKMAWLLGFP